MKKILSQAFFALSLVGSLEAMEKIDKKFPDWSKPPSIDFNLQNIKITTYENFLKDSGRVDNDVKSTMFMTWIDQVPYFLKGCDFQEEDQPEWKFNSHKAFTEVFAYHASQAIDFPYVPHTFILTTNSKFDSSEEGVLGTGRFFIASRFVEEAQTFYKILNESGSFVPESSYKIIEQGDTLRAILRMRDKHAGNIMIDSQGHPVFIDHESLFQEQSDQKLKESSKAHFAPGFVGAMITLGNSWNALKKGEFKETWNSLLWGFTSCDPKSCFDSKVIQDLKNPHFWQKIIEKTLTEIKLPEEDVSKFLGVFVNKKEENIEEFSKWIANNAQNIFS